MYQEKTMAIVSVSEAARLVGKSRRTIQRDIAAGKLSKCDNGKKLDTSELLRVYGSLLNAPNDADKNEHMTQDVAPSIPPNVAEMRIRLAALEAENAALKDHLGSLKQAMLLLEHKEQQASTETTQQRKWWQLFKKSAD
jgi:hypothetical protein